MNSTGSIQVTTKGSTVIGVQHIDNGGVVYEYDHTAQELSIETSYFGYGRAVIVIPFANPTALKEFFNHCESMVEASLDQEGGVRSGK